MKRRTIAKGNGDAKREEEGSRGPFSGPAGSSPSSELFVADVCSSAEGRLESNNANRIDCNLKLILKLMHDDYDSF